MQGCCHRKWSRKIHRGQSRWGGGAPRWASRHIPAPESAPSRPPTSPHSPGKLEPKRAAWMWPGASTRQFLPQPRAAPSLDGCCFLSAHIIGGTWAAGRAEKCQETCSFCFSVFMKETKRGALTPGLKPGRGPVDSGHMGTVWALDWRVFEGVRRWAFELSFSCLLFRWWK